MKRSVLGIIIAVVAISAIAGIVIANSRDIRTVTTSTGTSMDNMDMSRSPEDNAGQAVAANTVTIDDFEFKPAKITVKKGTTVTWTNNDSASHDITPDNPSDDFKASELLKKGESYSFTFKTAGNYTYFCSPHPYMKGTVEVTE